MRILWLSNKVQSVQNQSGTGSWLDALSRELIRSGDVELANISRGPVTEILQQDFGKLRQWIIPALAKPGSRGLPSKPYVTNILKLVNEFMPDLIHVWGTEGYWGLFTARKLLKQPSLLEIQGLKFAIARVFAGGLTFREQIACIGLKEALRGSTIFQGKKQFRDWGEIEKEIISGHQFVTTQSPWLASQISATNQTCKMFHNEFALKDEFYEAEPWQPQRNFRIFCSTSYPSPFKGLHVAVRAAAILKQKYPAIELRIAGAHLKPGLRQDGFVAWITREARKLGVDPNLTWLGPLTTAEIVRELQLCSLAVFPTFVEGYCLALAEAMLLGTPSVVSFTGGTSYLAKDGETALFFSPGDEAMCAYQINCVLSDQNLARDISNMSRQIAQERNNPKRIANNQLDIYNKVVFAKG